jgi:hypothetical protein
MWEQDSSLRIVIEALPQSVHERGLNLLNIKAKNDAINIMWLKEYLRLTPMRPTWAKVVDLLINAVAPKKISKKVRMNAFLQSWDAPTWGAKANYIDEGTIGMIKVRKKYNLNLAMIRLTPNLCSQLPTWQ